MFRGGPFIKTWETFWTDPTSGSQALTAKVGALWRLNCAVGLTILIYL